MFHIYTLPNKLHKTDFWVKPDISVVSQSQVNTFSVLFPHLHSYIQVFTTPSLPVFFTFIFPYCFGIRGAWLPLRRTACTREKAVLA